MVAAKIQKSAESTIIIKKNITNVKVFESVIYCLIMIERRVDVCINRFCNFPIVFIYLLHFN